MNDLDKLYKYFVQHYANGYYCYSFVISPKPDGPYDSIHPAKAHRKLESTFKKYVLRVKGFSYIIFAELSQQGKYHVHGLMFHKCDAEHYSDHEKMMKNLRNWLRRTFGWNGFQRIFSLTDPYKTTDVRFLKRELTTTFEKVWTYITKDVKQFAFLYPFGSI